MRIDRILLGYVSIKIDPSDIKKAATVLLSSNLTASFDKFGKFYVPYFMLNKYKKALTGIAYTVGDVKGIIGFLIKNKKRYGVFSALAILIIYFIFVSGMVWDIRVEGESSVADSIILKELSDAGMDVGSRWASLSQSEVERSVLENSSKIGWLNINRRGNVAYISVKDKNSPENKNELKTYTNIVASSDCIIEEIRVEQGIPCVKAGDSVKKGQLLISGVIPAELGGGFVRASGEVKGRINEEIFVFVPREESVNKYGKEELSSVSLKIFKFSINIFKIYGKKEDVCAIIDDRKEFVLFGKRIPLGLYRTYTQEVFEETLTRSDAELTETAMYRLSKLRIIRLSDSELLKMRTKGEFKDNGYEISSSVVVLRDVGEEKHFD